MLCAAAIEVGPGRETFWALWDREERALRENTRHVVPVFAGPQVRFTGDEVSVRSRDVAIDLRARGRPGDRVQVPRGGRRLHVDPEARGRRRPRA